MLSANANIAAAAGADGRLRLGWTNLRGGLTMAESAGALFRDRATELQVVLGQTGDAAPVSSFPPPVVPKISSARRWLAFGDSITDGYTLVGGKPVIDPGYPDNLRSRLGAALPGGAEVFDGGVGGETTVAGLNRFAGALAGTAATGVVIMEGTNDISVGFAASLSAFNLLQMAILAAGSGVTTLLAAVLPRNEQGFGGSRNAATNDLNGRLPAAAAAAGATVVDTHGPFMGRSDLFVDHLHPSPAGYDFLGGLVFSAINALPPEGGGGAKRRPRAPPESWKWWSTARL